MEGLKTHKATARLGQLLSMFFKKLFQQLLKAGSLVMSQGASDTKRPALVNRRFFTSSLSAKSDFTQNNVSEIIAAGNRAQFQPATKGKLAH